MAKRMPGKPQVIRGRVSLEDVVAEFERRRPFDAWNDPDYAAMKAALGHPAPESDTSYADAKAEIDAGGITIASIRRPDSVPRPASEPTRELTPAEEREQGRRKVLEIRDRLIAEGARYHGYGTIAKEAGWSATTVRELLGKEPRKRQTRQT